MVLQLPASPRLMQERKAEIPAALQTTESIEA
jgi:hypothetical protein